MKKVHALALLCIPLCLTMGFIIPTWTVGDLEQEQQVPEQGYSFESEYYSMQELGKLLERFGREIQQNGSVTVAGRSYPITGFGKVEISVGDRGINMQIGSGQTAPPTRGETYEIYKRGSLGATPSDVAEFLAKIGENLASSGNIVMEDYSVALEGTATVTQRLVENRQRGLQRRTYLLDIAFGQGDLPRPDDEEDIQERVERGESTILAEREFTDVNQARLARLFASLSRDLRAGRVSVGDREVPAGERASASFMHSIATDGQSQRVSVSFRFGEVTPRPEPEQPQPDEPKYGKETIGRIPINEIGQLLKRVGIEILESGTITFEGVAYRAGQSGSYELGMRHDRFQIELGTDASPPPPPPQ